MSNRSITETPVFHRSGRTGRRPPKRRLRRLGVCGLCLIITVAIISGAPPPARAVWLDLPDSRETFVYEPIFKSRAYVYEAGRRHDQTVVLVHGLGDNAARDWKSVIPVLAEKYHVLTFDLPGFGRSEKANRHYSPRNYVAFVKYIAEHFISGPFFLVGHSLGGTISLRYAGTYPGDVTRLVLVDIPGVLHRRAYSQFLLSSGIDALPPYLPNQDRHLQGIAGWILNRLAGKSIPDPLILHSALAREKLLGGDPVKIAGYALAVDDLSGPIQQVRAPTLIIWGTADRIAPLRTGKLLAATLSDARLVQLENIGHVPMKECLDRFNNLIAAFLEKPDRKPKASTIRASNPRPNKAPKPNGFCRDNAEKIFEGEYERIEIVGCKKAIVKNVAAEQVWVLDSTVEIENSRISSEGRALYAWRSSVQVTGSRVQGDVAVEVKESRLDIAGSTLLGKTAAVRMAEQTAAEQLASPSTMILFSVSAIHSPYRSGSIHGPVSVTVDKPL